MKVSASFWASSSPVGIAFDVEENRDKKAFGMSEVWTA